MIERGRLWPMKVAIRCLQVFTVILFLSYAYYFLKFDGPSSLHFSTKHPPAKISSISSGSRGGGLFHPADKHVPQWLKTKVRCENRNHTRRVYQKLDYWVVENFIKADRQFDCSETVTFATFGEFPDLYHLVNLVQHWHQPISLALYCANKDYQNCLDTLVFLRNCLDIQSQIYFLRKYMSVHIFFEDAKIPKNVYKGLHETKINCHDNPMSRSTHRSTTNDLYRRNVARNIAKEAALTHYVLSSDIEMYPSEDLAANFLRMIALAGSVEMPDGTVYLLPVLEINNNSNIPTTKREMQHEILIGNAIPSHRGQCSTCRKIPDTDRWTFNLEKTEMSIISLSNETHQKVFWEPFFISTRQGVYYDEWIPHQHGTSLELGQQYVMCFRDHQLVVLNNAFLGHLKIENNHREAAPRRSINAVTLDDVRVLHEFMLGLDYECNAFYRTRREQ